jgi:hypothetical protein
MSLHTKLKAYIFFDDSESEEATFRAEISEAIGEIDKDVKGTAIYFSDDSFMDDFFYILNLSVAKMINKNFSAETFELDKNGGSTKIAITNFRSLEEKITALRTKLRKELGSNDSWTPT